MWLMIANFPLQAVEFTMRDVRWIADNKLELAINSIHQIHTRELNARVQILRILTRHMNGLF